MAPGVVRFQKIDVKKAVIARELRKTSTKAESELWELLRGRKLAGLKFRRQQVIAGYIADFYCDESDLCVELDGDIHDAEDRKLWDENRTDAINSYGVEVLRIRNDEVFADPEAALKKIKDLALKRRHPRPQTTPFPLSATERGKGVGPKGRGIRGEVQRRKR